MNFSITNLGHVQTTTTTTMICDCVQELVCGVRFVDPVTAVSQLRHSIRDGSDLCRSVSRLSRISVCDFLVTCICVLNLNLNFVLALGCEWIGALMHSLLDALIN